MALNQKLTRVIGGRSVAGVDTDVTQSVVRFDDGSRMVVKLAPPPGVPPAAPPAAPAQLGKVTRVRQSGTSLAIDLDTGATIAFTTPEPMSSVLLRAANGALEYAD